MQYVKQTNQEINGEEKEYTRLTEDVKKKHKYEREIDVKIGELSVSVRFFSKRKYVWRTIS